MGVAVAALLGAYLIWVGGWPIFLLGVLSILSGWAYTGGPLPIAYTPLGELFVVAFFGLGAVCGTYWLCTETIAPAAIEAGLAVGCLTGAVLLVNNHRDAEADARVGRGGDRGRPGRDRLDLCGADADPCSPCWSDRMALPAGRVWPALIVLPWAVDPLASPASRAAGSIQSCANREMSIAVQSAAVARIGAVTAAPGDLNRTARLS